MVFQSKLNWKTCFFKSGVTLVALLCFLLPNSSQAASYQDQLNKINSDLENSYSNLSPEAQTELRKYKHQIEQNAYETTLKLCEGYRRVKRMGPTRYHGQWKYTEAQALKVWGDVYARGANTFFSAVNGVKREYIDSRLWQHQIPGTSKGDFYKSLGKRILHEFFWSVGTIYYLNSTGFALGALHCLEIPVGSTIPAEVNRFMLDILKVDIAGSVTTEVLTGAALKKFLATTFGRIIFWPIRKVLSIFKSKVVTASTLLVSNVAMNKVFDFYYEKRMEILEASRKVQELIENPEIMAQANSGDIYLSQFNRLHIAFNTSLLNEEKVHEQPLCQTAILMDMHFEKSEAHKYFTEEKIQECYTLYEGFLVLMNELWTIDAHNFFLQESQKPANPNDSFRILVKGFYPMAVQFSDYFQLPKQ